MAAKPLTTEAIALTEKKMDMTLDDIIKMSKNNGSKDKKQRRVPSKSHGFMKGTAQEKSAKVRRFMDSRSSLRQGVLAQRRSNFQGNQFPLATEFARKAAVAPLRNRAFSHNRLANWKARVAAPPVQRRAGNRGFVAKQPAQQQHRQQQQGEAMPKQQQQQRTQTMPKQQQQQQQQRTQTLDSLFANMKEQRMRVLSRKNNGAVPRNRNGQQRPPWGRGRF